MRYSEKWIQPEDVVDIAFKIMERGARQENERIDELLMQKFPCTCDEDNAHIDDPVLDPERREQWKQCLRCRMIETSASKNGWD